MTDKFITLTDTGDYADEVTLYPDAIVAMHTTRVSDGYGGIKKITSVHLSTGYVFTVREAQHKVRHEITLAQESKS